MNLRFTGTGVTEDVFAFKDGCSLVVLVRNSPVHIWTEGVRNLLAFVPVATSSSAVVVELQGGCWNHLRQVLIDVIHRVAELLIRFHGANGGVVHLLSIISHL